MNKPASELIALADNHLPDWNDLPGECRNELVKAASWHAEEWNAGQCALDIYNKLRETLPAQKFPLFDRTAANQSGSERAGVDRAKLAEWADDFEAAAHEVPRGIKSTILMTRAQEVREALATPPAQPAPASGESCANSILRAIWDDIETAAVETPVDNYECADIRPETLARLADHLAARNWKDKADVDLPPDDCRTAILPISVRGSESADLLQPVARGPSETPSTHGKPDGAVREIFQNNLREAWSALAMIRETVETLGPVGAMKASEHLDGPTFMHEAEAIVAGIAALHSPKIAAADNILPDDLDARIAWLQDKSADLGYNLVGEPEHPDSPHAAAETSPGDVLAMKEACKRVVLDLTKEWGDPNGTDGEQGAQNHGARIYAAIDRLAEAKSQQPETVAIVDEINSLLRTASIFNGCVKAPTSDLLRRCAAALYTHPTTKPEASAVSVDAIDRAIAAFLDDEEWQRGGLGIEDKRNRMRSAIAALIAGGR